jgi:hypothetical protein
VPGGTPAYGRRGWLSRPAESAPSCGWLGVVACGLVGLGVYFTIAKMVKISKHYNVNDAPKFCRLENFSVSIARQSCSPVNGKFLRSHKVGPAKLFQSKSCSKALLQRHNCISKALLAGKIERIVQFVYILCASLWDSALIACMCPRGQPTRGQAGSQKIASSLSPPPREGEGTNSIQFVGMPACFASLALAVHSSRGNRQKKHSLRDRYCTANGSVSVALHCQNAHCPYKVIL